MLFIFTPKYPHPNDYRSRIVPYEMKTEQTQTLCSHCDYTVISKRLKYYNNLQGHSAKRILHAIRDLDETAFHETKRAK